MQRSALSVSAADAQFYCLLLFQGAVLEAGCGIPFGDTYYRFDEQFSNRRYRHHG